VKTKLIFKTDKIHSIYFFLYDMIIIKIWQQAYIIRIYMLIINRSLREVHNTYDAYVNRANGRLWKLQFPGPLQESRDVNCVISVLQLF
jgi:hypothetical protein